MKGLDTSYNIEKGPAATIITIKINTAEIKISYPSILDHRIAKELKSISEALRE